MSQIDSVMSDLRNLDSNMDVLEVALNEEKEKIHERIDGHGNDTLITLYENVEGEGQQALDRNGDLEMKRRLAKAYLDRLPSGIKTLGWDKDIKKLKSARWMNGAAAAANFASPAPNMPRAFMKKPANKTTIRLTKPQRNALRDNVRRPTTQ